jgi:pimeloyl-ACP methyl ester carboxylesterase
MNRTMLGIGGAAALAAALVRERTHEAERTHPPLGRFLNVDGVRLHYVEEGDGPPLVLLHGLGSMVEDFVLSGLLREASQRFRVIAFDRPGYGHSERPRRFKFGPLQQARLLHKALQELGAQRPIVLGHSWGTLVAISLLQAHPAAARSLVLASGLYFPTLRLDAPLMGGPAIPLLGDLMSWTISPLISRATWRAGLKLVFTPAPVPASFDEFPTWMALRPSQLRAQAEDALATLPWTVRSMARYRELTLPVVLVAGGGDRFVRPMRHTGRLARMLPNARLMVSRKSGHMVHHTDLPLMLAAIDAASRPGA